MADYAAIGNDEIDAGSPLNASLFSRLARNPQAIAEGAAGAPRVRLEAFEALAAGEVAQWSLRGSQTVLEADQLTYEWFIVQPGSLRISARARRSNGSGSVTATVLFDGATVGSRSFGGTDTWEIDIPVRPRGLLSFRFSVGNTAGTRGELIDLDLMTDGQSIMPTGTSDEWILL